MKASNQFRHGCHWYSVSYKAPIDPPTKINTITKMKPVEKLPMDKKVTVIAITIPKIPKSYLA